jgi:hypothetical protein
MARYRIKYGEFEGSEGQPHELSTKTGLYSIKTDDGSILKGLKKDQLMRLECELINCRTYTGDSRHSYCQKCQPTEKKEEPSPFATLYEMARQYIKNADHIEEIDQIISKIKSKEIPITPLIITELCAKVREHLLPCLPEEARGGIEEILVDMESVPKERK